jgi:hypothetical protein
MHPYTMSRLAIQHANELVETGLRLAGMPDDV